MIHFHRWDIWLDRVSKTLKTTTIKEFSRGYANEREITTTEELEKVVFTQERRCRFCNLIQVIHIERGEPNARESK